MKLKKTLPVIAVIIGLFFAFIFYLLSSKKTQPVITSDKISPPSIPELIKGEIPIQTSLVASDLNFPSELPIITVSKETISKDFLDKTSKKLDFTEDPQQVVDISEGLKYFWTSEKAFLSATVSTRTLDYSLNSTPKNPVNLNLSDEDLINISKRFIEDNFLERGEEVEFSSFTYLKANGSEDVRIVNSKTEANVYQANFNSKIAQYPIISINPNTPSIYAKILSDGTLVNVSVVKHSNIKLSSQMFKIKSSQTVLDSLKNAKLISVANIYTETRNLDIKSFSTINIDKIKLAYLIESPNSEYYQPIFILSGRGTVKGFSNEIVASLYLPAIEN